MTYKFSKSEDEFLEVTQMGKAVEFYTSNEDSELSIILTKEQLFDLIGSLLTIQAKLKNT